MSLDDAVRKCKNWCRNYDEERPHGAIGNKVQIMLMKSEAVTSRLFLMTLIGYARISSGEQSNVAQAQALQAAGCIEVHKEQVSGGSRSRLALARARQRIGKGDTLVVVRIDRLARSLSHLLDVIERLGAQGAFFRSLQDPIDTASPQGKFTLQVLGAAAEFERALIRERTKAGLASARTKGRVGGNPGMRARDPAALR